jgi:DNA-binding NarL/FixJ family response regulator
MHNQDKIHILVVDDHPLIRSGIIRAIGEDEQMSVCAETDNVEDAIQLVEQHLPNLVIADLSLEGSDGFDLIRYLGKRDPSIPVLVISMHDHPIYIENAFKAGAKGYILKRESNHKITQAIRQVMTGKIYTSEKVSESFFESISTVQNSMEVNPKEVLTKREFEVFLALGDGLTRSEIADKLNVSLKTIETHIERIKPKVNVPTAARLIHLAIKYKLTTRSDQ